MKRLIIFLIRKKLGLRDHQQFQFDNQKTNATYFFKSDKIMKIDKDGVHESSVSLNWLLNDECKIIKF